MMKKHRLIVIAFALSVVLSGCGKVEEAKSKPLTVDATYITDISNDGVVNLAIEYKRYVSVTRADAPPEFTVEFGGVQYTGKYTVSMRGDCSFYFDRYATSDGMAFMVNAETGAFQGIHLCDDGYYERVWPKEDQLSSEEDAIKIAEKYAGKYIDISKCQVEVLADESVMEFDGTKYKGTIYYVRFRKCVAGMLTMDSLKVGVTSKGDLMSLHMAEIGAFDGIQDGDVPLEEISAAVEAKLKEKFQDCRDTYLGCEIEEHTLVMMPDKTFAVLSEVAVSVKKDAGTFRTLIDVITTLK